MKQKVSGGVEKAQCVPQNTGGSGFKNEKSRNQRRRGDAGHEGTPPPADKQKSAGGS